MVKAGALSGRGRTSDSLTLGLSSVGGGLMFSQRVSGRLNVRVKTFRSGSPLTAEEVLGEVLGM